MRPPNRFDHPPPPLADCTPPPLPQQLFVLHACWSVGVAYRESREVAAGLEALKGGQGLPGAQVPDLDDSV